MNQETGEMLIATLKSLNDGQQLILQRMDFLQKCAVVEFSISFVLLIVLIAWWKRD